MVDRYVADSPDLIYSTVGAAAKPPRSPELGLDIEEVIARQHPTRPGALPHTRKDGTLAEVLDDVIGDRYVLDHAPRAAASLIARSQNEAGRPLLTEGGVAVDPAVLKNIAVDQHPLGVFQLEKVLNRPVDARVRGAAGPPRQRLDEMIAPDLDIRGHQIDFPRVGSTKQNIFRGPFDTVIDDLKRARAEPADDSLSIRITDM